MILTILSLVKRLPGSCFSKSLAKAPGEHHHRRQSCLSTPILYFAYLFVVFVQIHSIQLLLVHSLAFWRCLTTL